MGFSPLKCFTLLSVWCRFRDKPLTATVISLLLHSALMSGLLFGGSPVRPTVVTKSQVGPPVTVTWVTTVTPKLMPAKAGASEHKLTPPEPLKPKASTPESLSIKVARQHREQPLLAEPENVVQKKAPGQQVAPLAAPTGTEHQSSQSGGLLAEPLDTIAGQLPAQAAQAAPATVAPVSLRTELAVNCPHRPAPAYPAIARRLRESGRVLVKVWLSAQGQVEQTQIVESSGFARLDNAAVAAVQSWRCQAAVQQGIPVPAVALQPFHFAFNS